jgi:D-sedoheptulose 7-phosphate isomerase
MGWSPTSTFATAARDLAALLAQGTTLGAIDRFYAELGGCFRGGKKVLACGNGGSLCDAMHFCEELTGRFRAAPAGKPDRPPLPAIALADASHITCTANDFGFEHVFARGITAFAGPGDVCVLLSTSGTSPNILRAADAARAAGAITVGLTGRGGGSLGPRCDVLIDVPGETSDRIQELHMLILHAAVESVERALYPELWR